MAALQNAFSSSAPIREKREIITDSDAATGIVTYEEWRKNGKWDRADGPACIRRDAATGTVTKELWYSDDRLDRADGPAFIERGAATGIVTYEAWWKDGKQFEPSTAQRAAWLEKSGERMPPPTNVIVFEPKPRTPAM